MTAYGIASLIVKMPASGGGRGTPSERITLSNIDLDKTTVGGVKTMIESTTALSMADRRIIYNFRVLSDPNVYLRAAGVTDGSTLHLAGPPVRLDSRPEPVDLVWTNEEKTVGRAKNRSGMEVPIFGRKRWLEWAVKEVLSNMAGVPLCEENPMPTPCRLGSFSPMAHPTYSYHDVDRILQVFRKHLPSLVLSFIDRASPSSSPSIVSDDFLFLMNLGRTRKWKQDCAICLSEKIVGTTCGCGHTEIVVMRPCGHSLCANPCYHDLSASGGHEAEGGVAEYGEEKYHILDVTKGTLKRKLAPPPSNMSCPMCRSSVKTVFRAEEVTVNDECVQWCVERVAPLVEETINLKE